MLLFATLLVGGSFFHPRVEYDNSRSRYLLVSAIVDYHVLDIDRFERFTVDKAFFDGHYYSNKAIGGPLAAVPFYWVLRALPSTHGEQPLSPFHVWLLCILTTGIPFAILGVVLMDVAVAWGARATSALWMVLAFAFGSIAWVHAGIFSGHSMAGTFSFLGFAGAQRLRRKGSGTLLAALSGLAVGFGALCDYTAMYLAAVLSAYVLWCRIPGRAKAAFLLAGASCAAVLMVYNHACFGSALSLSYGHQTLAEFAEGSERGLLGVSLPAMKPLAQLLVSPARGLFFIMPVFLFSLFGLAELRKRRELRPEIRVLVAASAGYLLINAGFYGWHGGWTYGPRYLVPMLPFLALPMAFAPLRTPFFALALALSVLQVGLSVVGMPHTPEAFLNPLPDVILPLMQRGYTADTWLGRLGVGSALAIPFGVAATALLAGASLRAAARLEAPGAGVDALGRPQRIAVVVAAVGIAGALLTVRAAPGAADPYLERLLRSYHRSALDVHLRELESRGETR